MWAPVFVDTTAVVGGYLDPMEAVSGHALAASVDCKVPGCDQAAEQTRGVYALLCQTRFI